MDNIILFFSLTVFTFTIIFMLFEVIGEDNLAAEDVRSRLKKYTVKDQVGFNKKQKESFKDKFINFIEPFAASFHKKINKPEQEQGIKKLLMECGMGSSNEDVIRFVALQIFLCTIFTGISLFLALFSLKQNILISFILVILSIMVGYRLPLIKLKSISTKRSNEIRKTLPDALDLLIVCIEAGLGLDAALSKVSSEQMRYATVLSKELGRVSKDILGGIPRQDAFRNLSKRNNSDELRALVALLIQTDKLGTSIGTSLRVYADTLRTKRRQKAEELAAKASTKMVVPLVLFILPATFIILLAPAFITLAEQFMSMGK